MSLDELRAQAQWKREAERIEASLTDAERRLRARFDKFLGPDRPPELSSLEVCNPTSLIVYGEAYRRAGETAAMMLCVMVWLALKGHDGALELLQVPRSMALPPVPAGWRWLRGTVYAALGEEWIEPDNVSHLADFIAGPSR